MTSACAVPLREQGRPSSSRQGLRVPAARKDRRCSTHAGDDGSSWSCCVAREGGSLLGVQAVFASRWSQSTCLRSSDASPHVKVSSQSPQCNTILGMVYSSRRIKRRGPRTMFTSHFAYFWPLAEAAPRAAEATKEPAGTFSTHDVHHWAQTKLSPNDKGSRDGKQVPCGQDQSGQHSRDPQTLQEGCEGIQQTSLTHAPRRQLKPPGALALFLADLTSNDTSPREHGPTLF